MGPVFSAKNGHPARGIAGIAHGICHRRKTVPIVKSSRGGKHLKSHVLEINKYLGVTAGNNTSKLNVRENTQMFLFLF